MTQVNITSPSNTVTVDNTSDITVVTATTAGPQGAASTAGINIPSSNAYTTPVNTDFLIAYDTSEAGHRKITIEDLLAKRARDSRRIYISKDTKANDSNNGTSPEEPLATFAAAIAAAESGDVIEVAPGTYVESSLPLRVPRDVGIFAKSLRQVKIQPASGQEMNGFFKVDSGFWCWGLEFAGHQADLANGQQAWAISFDDQADNTGIGASGTGAFILKSPYVQNCSSVTAEDDAGNAGSTSTGDTGGGLEIDGDKCAANSPIRSIVVDSYTQVNLGGPGCLCKNDGYAQLVSFFGTFCTFHVKAETGGQVNLSGGGTTDFGTEALVADGFSRLPNFTGSARLAAFGADRVDKAVTIDVSSDTFTTTSDHGLSANDEVTFTVSEGSFPTGIAAETTFHVISSGLTSRNFKVSTTSGGSALDITGSASGTYQVVRQGATSFDVISLTSNRIGTQSRPNPGQLVFPRATFPSAGQSGASGSPVSVSAVSGSTFTVTLPTTGFGHTYVTGGTVTVGGTSYNIATLTYDNTTGVTQATATGYSPSVSDSVFFTGLEFICPTEGVYTVVGSVPIDSSGNTVAADSGSLAGYRVNFYNTVNGGLRTPLLQGQTLDFRLRSQVSCSLHTMEYVGSGTNYNALPWNGGVPIPGNQRVETNNGRVFGATINEKGDFEIGGGTFSIDGTTGAATINTSDINISGLNFIGPFSRNGGFSTVGVQLKEVSNNTSLLASTGGADGNTAPTQNAVKTYIQNNTVSSVGFVAPTGFSVSGSPITSSGDITLAYASGYQGFTTAESTKLAGIESNATADQTATEIKTAYESNSDTNAFTDADHSKLDGIESAATADQTASEIRALVGSASDSNVFTDADHTKLDGIEAGATADQTASEIKTAYEGNSDTNAFTDSEKTKLAAIEASADVTDAANVNAAGAVMNTDTTTASMNFVVDEDNMSSNSATKVPTQQSVKAYVDTEVAGVVDSAPAALDTLNELAAALGDDANFSTTVTTSIGTKLPLAGGTMTGNIVMSSTETVDGRDLSVDGAKLDGIEAGATADQTAAEIRTLVGSASDSNVFTDADHTKLDGIEANATADQTASEIKTAYESNSDTNAFTDADHTKLDGIEANADVTDATNVNAAGAVMNTDTSTESMSFVVDEDNMSSNSASKVPTQQSVKAYVTDQLAGLEADKITEGNTNAEVVDSGSDGHFKVTTEGVERLRVGPEGQIGIAGTNYGTSGQVITSGGSSGAVSWTTLNPQTNLSYTDSTRVIASSTGNDATLPLMSSGNAGLVPASGGGTSNFLRADGTFAVPQSGTPLRFLTTTGTGTFSLTEDNFTTVDLASTLNISDSSDFTVASSGEVTVQNGGTYYVEYSLNGDYTGSSSRQVITGVLQLNTGSGFVDVEETTFDAYTRDSGSETSGFSVTGAAIITLSANDVLRVQSERSDSQSAVINRSKSRLSLFTLSGSGPAGPTGASGPSDIPQNSQTSAYTLVVGDNGKHINITTGGVTVPSGVFSVGNVVTVYNDSGSDQTITQGSSVTLRLAGSASTGNRTLAQYGLCTVLCVGTNEFVISGAGLT